MGKLELTYQECISLKLALAIAIDNNTRLLDQLGPNISDRAEEILITERNELKELRRKVSRIQYAMVKL